VRVLLVEDDIELINVLIKGFKEEGIQLDGVIDTIKATDYIDMVNYDVIILDKNLPGLDGVSFCSRLRQLNNRTPILILSAEGDSDSKVNGLNGGADDYLEKPFHFPELIARIRALSKRTTNIQNHILKINGLSLNLMSRELKISDKIITLRNNEFNLLALLLKRKNQVVTKTEIIDYIWNLDDFFDLNILNVTVYNLRKKIELYEDKKLLHTVRGIGYKIVDI